MTIEEFAPMFNRLAVQLNHDADAEQIRAYFDVFSDISLDAVHAAGAYLAKTAKWFPKTSEWREAALRIEQDKRRSELVSVRTWNIECDLCDDSGWRYYDCDGDKFCGREKTHLPHKFVRVCDCRPTNHTYQRHHPPVRIV